MNRSDYFSRGIYVSAMTNSREIYDLIRLLWPFETSYDLIRVGSDRDGGYLIPNDLTAIKACFSPGVANTVDFEADLLDRFGIRSHLADFSVTTPPALELKTFTKLNLACYESESTMTLEDWIDSKEPESDDSSLILQMDIEGAEYHVLLNTPRSVLKKFRIIVIEIHEVWAWGSDSFYKIAHQLFTKMLQDFIPVHLHPNNVTGRISLGEVIVPQAFEITLINKARVAGFESLKYSRLPHALDRPNEPKLVDSSLPAYWMGTSFD